MTWFNNKVFILTFHILFPPSNACLDSKNLYSPWDQLETHKHTLTHTHTHAHTLRIITINFPPMLDMRWFIYIALTVDLHKPAQVFLAWSLVPFCKYLHLVFQMGHRHWRGVSLQLWSHSHGSMQQLIVPLQSRKYKYM